MTLKDLRKLVEKDIYDLLDKEEYNFNDTLIYKKCENEILRGVFFEKSNAIKGGVYVYCFVLPLMIKTEDIYFNFGQRLKAPDGREVWLLDRINREESIKKLIPELMNFSLFEDVVDATSFIKHFSKISDDVRGMEAISLCCCWADLNRYKFYLNKMISFIEEYGNLSWDWVVEIYNAFVAMEKLDQKEFRNYLEREILANKENFLGVKDA